MRDRGYTCNLIANTVSEVTFSKRMSALQNKQKTRKRILPFVTGCRLSVPNIKKKNILMRKWHLIENQPLLQKIYRLSPALIQKREVFGKRTRYSKVLKVKVYLS